MRREFSKVITELAAKDKDIYLIIGDIGYSLFEEFIRNFPKRLLNIGLCEQSMISVAAGMALEGLKPYVYAITPFLIERPWEQVKIDIDQQKANVTLVGYADYPTHGPTHSLIHEENLVRLLKNTRLYFPKNSDETRIALYDAFEHYGPAFISLKKDKLK